MELALSFDEILSLDKSQLQQLQQTGDFYPNADAPGACEAFAAQVNLLESCVKHTYAMCVAMVRKAELLQDAAKAWGKMDVFCSLVLETLSSLQVKYPHCGTGQLHDKVLEYKHACSERYRGVLEEIECQKAEFPKGLFPEMT